MIGTSLGPYRILEPLGSGGMGEVYLAQDSRTGRSVAIRVLPAEFAGDPGRMPRFEQEARVASALDHPGICALYDVGSLEGKLFLVMEALEGATLEELIGGRPLTTDGLLDIAIQVAGALAYAHDNGVLHRDLKSSNIFVTDGGRAKILDFGLAELVADLGLTKLVAESDADDLTPMQDGQRTREGSMPGTIAHMSPEQARGQALEPSSDLFSFGVVIFEMATGTLPFTGPTEAVIFDQILTHDPPSLVSLNSRLPAGLVRLVGKAIQKRPEARFGSADEIKGHLEEIRRAPGSLESILPAEHVSSSAAVKLPPRPEEWSSEPDTDLEPDLQPDAAPEPGPARGPSPQKFLPLWPPADES